MNKILKPVAVATLLASTALLFAGPEIKRETREENGKKINYMWIDGIKVHETGQATAAQNRRAGQRRSRRQTSPRARRGESAVRRQQSFACKLGQKR
jgi:hypothetical protein